MKDSIILIYDDACPMCAAYSKLFVTIGLLSSKGRIAYSDSFNEKFNGLIDREKAVNEIPLIDLENHSTYYGLDSLLEILSRKWILFKIIKKIKPLYWFLQKCYLLISYNRKVIIPPRVCNANSCNPKFNLKYRVLFFMISMLITAFVFYQFSETLSSTRLQSYTGSFGLDILLLFIPSVIGQIVVSYMIQRQYFWDYIGNVATFNLEGAGFLIVWSFLFYFSSNNIQIVFWGLCLSVILKGVLNIKRSTHLGITIGYASFWSITFLTSFLLGWFLLLI